ncbi:MAG TPA: hypothetical protein VG871_24955, partial [Vicinamibacterales bacterium]|nr:hypothetical protein [Vicinamibacterales bacterium]
MLRRTSARLPIILLAVLAAAGLLAWWGTSRPILLDLDWDQAFHYWQIDGILTSGDHMCSAGGTLWTCAYTAHMALQPLYGLAALVTRHFHGTTLNAMRGVNAVAIAIAAGCLVLTLARLDAAWWALVLVPAAWLLSSDVLFLVRTIEDDCLLLACASAVCFFCVKARTQWSVWSAFAAGAILGAGVLTNYSVIVWSPVLFVAGVILARPDLPLFDRRRIAWGAAILAGMATPIAAWGAWSHVDDPANWSWARYAQVMFGSPN